MRDLGLRHAIPAHLIETMASHQAKQEKQAGEPGYQFARNRRLHDSHAGQLGRSRADLVDPHMVAMAVAALPVVAQQQIRLLVSQDAGKLSGGLLNIGPREPGPAWRVLEKDRSVPAVGVAQMYGLGRAKDRGARPQLVQPPAGVPIRVGPHLTVAGHHDDYPMASGREPCDRPSGQQHLVIRMSVKRNDRRHHRERSGDREFSTGGSVNLRV